MKFIYRGGQIDELREPYIRRQLGRSESVGFFCFQIGARYPYVNRSHYLMINAGPDSSTAIIQLSRDKTAGTVRNLVFCNFLSFNKLLNQWPRGLRRRSVAARLLRLWVRIPPGAWMSVCCECYVCCQVEVSATG